MEVKAYLDNAATTKPFECVKEVVLKVMDLDYGNPSSLHIKGLEAEHYVKEAKKTIAASLKVEEKELLFTSGGTESNNLALIGAAFANKRSGNHMIATKMEHPSVLNPLFYLEECGFEVTYLNVDAFGLINVDELLNEIRDTTILVSVMYVNNEIGSLQDIATIGRRIKEKKKEVLFHVDAIQAYGKFRIAPKRENIDLLSVSAHKIHGPKGVGFLFVRDKVKIKPILFGGQQQRGLRSGTENVPGIAGLSQAVKEIYKDYENTVKRLYELKQFFVEELKSMEGVLVNGVNHLVEQTAPHIISASFSGIRSEVLLHALENMGICVSAGSACATNHPEISGTLKAIGIKKELLDATLRFSLSVYTTKEELLLTCLALKELLPKLRKFTRH